MSTLSSYDDFIVSPAEQRARAAARRQRFMATTAPKPRPKPTVIPVVEPVARRWEDRWDDPLRSLAVSYSRLRPATRPATMRAILDFAAVHFGLHKFDVAGTSRERRYVNARHVVCWMMRNMTGQSLPQIGRAMGGRDHTTILHACRRIDAALDANDELGRMARDAVEAFEMWRHEA